jgi:carbohydrate-selective porin OprB
MSYPEATASSNNGLMMQGYAPDPSQNGLYFMGETGVTPELGPARLPGRYAFGGYFYGEHREGSGGDKYGFYWQADQMLYREPSAPADGKTTALSREGLHLFSMATFAPPYNNNYPFYGQAGLVYEGLLPARHKDLTMAATGIGQYANHPDKTYTAVVELGYRIQINEWAWFQPSFQYLVRPDGSPDVSNAAVLGFFAGMNF